MSNRVLDESTISIPAGRAQLAGTLAIPQDALGMVLFAHGSGSSRQSPRNRQVAAFLQEARLGTLLMDLLTPAEERIDELSGELRFDIDLLTQRLLAASRWLADQSDIASIPLGYFGASTGAAAALSAAAQDPTRVHAVVSRGGRPDLAGEALPKVKSPTLLIVGGNDRDVLDVNQRAATYLHCEHSVIVIPGATHLFEEPGTLDEVARLARDWFVSHFSSAAHRAA